ncbi:MAG: ImmA/IrrE family metallo-endopeptidase [Candidatus Paceibacterota bacterium]|jgi:Zn-dependent peptidase ImmA (M78 family)
MNRADCESKANEIRKQYNPLDLSPFPYKNITDSIFELKIQSFEFSEDSIKNLSGAITYEEKDSSGVKTYEFHIAINSSKSQERQNFTLAHELGHYFLHKDKIKIEGIIVDSDFFDGGRALFSLDEAEISQMEIEANNFAYALIMPSELIVQAWESLRDVESCAKVFNVSVSTMSIRLERLKLLP